MDPLFDSDDGDISLSLTSASSMPTISSRSTSSSTRDCFPSQSHSGNGSEGSQSNDKLFGKRLWSAPSWSNDSAPSGSNSTPQQKGDWGNEDSQAGPSSSRYSVPPPRTDQRAGLGITSPTYHTNGGEITPTKHRPYPVDTTAQIPSPIPRRISSSTSTHSLNRSRSLGNRLSVPGAKSAVGSETNHSPTRNGARTPSMRLGWSRRPGEPRPPPMVEQGVRRRMERWVKEIVVCNFDLERGPVVERRAVGRRWGPGEKENV